MAPVLDSIKDIRRIITKEKPSRAVLLTTQKVSKILPWAVSDIKKQAGTYPVHTIKIPDGERAKEVATLIFIFEKLIKCNADKKTLLIILGGGTVGDVGGLAASMYLRGISYVQIPTTLLAQVDSAHGGKTGINFSGFKNQLGTIYDPVATIVDTTLLRSLSRNQIIDGLGEIIKYGVIKNPHILSLLTHETVDSLMHSKQLKNIIEKSINVKEYFTKKDKLDNNIRLMLNAGHTVAHALELEYTLSHGQAVLIGIIQELNITEQLGYTDLAVKQKLLKLLKQLHISLPLNLKPNMKALLRDKKIQGKYILLPTVTKIGKSKLVTIPVPVFKKYVKKF
jgi:3-dehydroquinate synthase